MLVRSFLLTLLALAFATPTAHAALAFALNRRPISPWASVTRGGSDLESEDKLGEMPEAFGGDAVPLASPDASPPPGKVGYFDGPGIDFVTPAVLADGRRVFLSLQDGVFSTKV